MLILESHQRAEMQTAVAGASTNVNIPCNLVIGEEAPFWLINDISYELFSIPLYFPYIPTVESFSQLTIPVVPLELNNTHFQCASYDEDGSDHRGTAVLLLVESR